MSETEWKTDPPDTKAPQVEIPEVLPLLPIRDIVIYPYMMLPLFVGRDVSIRAVEEALARDRLIFLVSQINSAEESPMPADIHRVGTIASIMRMIKLADGRVKILVQGLAERDVERFLRERPFFEVNIRKVVDAKTIYIGVSNPDMSFLSGGVAHFQGYFKDEGLDVDVLQMNANVSVAALAAGNIDYNLILQSVVTANLRGLPLKVTGILIEHLPSRNSA